MPSRSMTFTLAALCLALCGCSGSTSAPPTRTVHPSTPASSPRVHDSSARTTPADQIPEDWQPQDAQLTSAHWRALKERVLRENHLTEQELGDVRLVRVMPTTEWARAQVECVKQAGFKARVSQGGIAYEDTPQEQARALDIASGRCELQYPIDPRATRPLPKKRARMQYQHLVTSVKPCVEQKFHVRVEPPPTEEVWLATYYAGSKTSPAWDPFSVFEQGDDVAQLDRAYEECPHDAPGLYSN